MKEEDVPQTALLSTAFFVASLIHVPVAGVNVHLMLNGLVGLLLGWAAFPAILVAAWLQAVFFGYGGITTLGINTFSMAMPGVLCHYLLRGWASRGGSFTLMAGFLAGVLGVSLSGLIVAAALAVSAVWLQPAAMIFAVGATLWAGIEGAVSAFTVSALWHYHPRFLQRFPPEGVSGELEEART
jgi:cobalt/nickel transport system permease protein